MDTRVTRTCEHCSLQRRVSAGGVSSIILNQKEFLELGVNLVEWYRIMPMPGPLDIENNNPCDAWDKLRRPGACFYNRNSSRHIDGGSGMLLPARRG